MPETRRQRFGWFAPEDFRDAVAPFRRRLLQSSAPFCRMETKKKASGRDENGGPDWNPSRRVYRHVTVRYTGNITNDFQIQTKRDKIQIPMQVWMID